MPFIKCDTKEADDLCGKFSSRGRGVAQVCCYCCCPASKTNDPLADYALKNKDDIGELIDANSVDELKKMSQQPIKNACYMLRFSADNNQGVHGGTPVDMLHGVLLGVFKYVRDVFFQSLGKSSQTHRQFLSLATQYGKRFQRHSDRDLLKTAFSNGINTGKKEAKEFVGIFLVIAAVLCSTGGRKILQKKGNFGNKGS